jgi:hypothetical protein
MSFYVKLDSGKSYKVWFRHTVENSEITNDHPLRDVTYCFISDQDSFVETLQPAGMAVRNPKDKCDKEVGRRAALTDALEMCRFFKGERSTFWKAYFEAKKSPTKATTPSWQRPIVYTEHGGKYAINDDGSLTSLTDDYMYFVTTSDLGQADLSSKVPSLDLPSFSSTKLFLKEIDKLAYYHLILTSTGFELDTQKCYNRDLPAGGLLVGYCEQKNGHFKIYLDVVEK